MIAAGRSLRAVAPVISAALCCVACEQCVPGRVGQGVSQLTIRNLGAVVELVNEDTVCGFGSEAVKSSYVQDGVSGTQGSAQWRVEGCVIDIARSDPRVTTDCNGVSTAIAGTVVVSATRTVEGYLTGDPTEPAIPRGPDAVTIEVTSATFERFQVDASDSSDFMIINSGALSGVVRPMLAAASDTGVCSIPTRNVAFTDVRYSNAEVRVITDSRDFIVPVSTSSLGAVNGRVGGIENRVFGSITVWGSDQKIPSNDGEPELNPDYDADVHLSGFECTDNLALPLDYDGCTTDIRPLVAQGASQLTVQLIGNLALLLDEDERCGFASDDVNLAVAIDGELGERGGRGTWNVSSPCEMHFPAKTEIDRDCNGKAIYAEGTVRLTGSKMLDGIPSGDPTEPIVPIRRDAALVTIEADFSDFSLWADPENHKLTVASGRLTANVHPRLAKDTVRGACSVKTPNSGFSEVAYHGARLVVQSDGRRFELGAESSSLEAQNGSKGARTNYLAGSITLDGETFAIPVGDTPTLDPDYDGARFVASYSCKPNIEIPNSDEACDMRRTIGEGAARLIVRSVGAVTGLTNSNSDCGFEAIRVLLRPSRVEGDPGQQGVMAWEIQDCRVGASGPAETDCLGRDKFVEGAVQVSARRTVQGLREKLISIAGLDLIDSIVPDTREAVEIELQRVLLTDFFNYELDPGQVESSKAIHIASGELSAVVRPITGENASKTDAFDVASPVAHMSRIQLRDAPIMILFEGKTFAAHVDSADLEAFNGSYDGLGMENQISGSITIDGHRIVFAPGSGLDPDFEQSDFDARYACTDDLVGRVPPMP